MVTADERFFNALQGDSFRVLFILARDFPEITHKRKRLLY
jgi:hypothetical protein